MSTRVNLGNCFILFPTLPSPFHGRTSAAFHEYACWGLLALSALLGNASFRFRLIVILGWCSFLFSEGLSGHQESDDREYYHHERYSEEDSCH